LTEMDKIIPVVVVDDPQTAVELARLYKSKGIGAIEITLRTDNAISCIRAVKDAQLGIRIGVGTVTTWADAESAEGLGVDFLVSPATSPDLLKFAQNSPVPMYLGFSTVSEALRLLEAGIEHGKFFPAEAAGGAQFLRALGSVLPKFRVFPTGGIHLSNLANYLDLENVIQIGGTWLAPTDSIEKRDWIAIDKILQQTQEYLASYERK